MTRREQAIAYIEQCRRTHADWAERQQTEPDWRDRYGPNIGDADHHLEWVERYDLVLAELRGPA